jgi:hypothetical protein
MRRREFVGALGLLSGAGLLGRAAAGVKSGAPLRVVDNPYAGIDWTRGLRLLAQHHDHVQTGEANYRAYDAAGYGALTVIHYSGLRSHASAWTERKWPIGPRLGKYASNEAFLSTCRNLKILIPGAEEIGFHHITSPFLTTYIERWEGASDAGRQPWHYDSTQGCLDLIQRYGGLAILAHPCFYPQAEYAKLRNYLGIEIYNAFYPFQFKHGKLAEDLNLKFLSLWDFLLTNVSPRIWGFAVNDWYGPCPFSKAAAATDPDIVDSGKIEIFLDEPTPGAYRQALVQGRFFAVVDRGLRKGGFPRIERIEAGPDRIAIEADGEISWLADGGKKCASGPQLLLAELPLRSTYVRAEIRKENSLVYSQPFILGAP